MKKFPICDHIREKTYLGRLSRSVHPSLERSIADVLLIASIAILTLFIASLGFCEELKAPTAAAKAECAVKVEAAAKAEAAANPEPERLPDIRLGPLKDLDGYFPFEPSQNAAAWQKRADRLRRQIRVALGLWPWPERTPLQAVIHSSVDRPEYTVERVYFQSVPGHYVSGSLYRPKGRQGKLPAVLCPHGHWAKGRFMDAGRDEVRRDIAIGGERFELGGRSPAQAMCVQLARMGCVAFNFDMIGYADSLQISEDVAHRFAKQRPEMDRRDRWGFFGAQAELRLQSIMGMQTWNAIRAYDFLEGLPDVDAQRIGVTGASGGGTQTFILGAIDPRPAAEFPAVMVGTAMQGGCTCENASLLRVGTGNVEFAALFAPKPLGMTGADDWTVHLATKGLPELKRHYAMLGAPENVMAAVMPQFKHNYNYVSREVMYHFFNKHLQLGLPEPIVEEDYQPLTVAEMTVWNDHHSRPLGGDDYEIALCKQLSDASDAELAKLAPRDAASLATYRETVGGALRAMIQRGFSETDNDDADTTDLICHSEGVTVERSDGSKGAAVRKRLFDPRYGEAVSGVYSISPNTAPTVYWFSSEGSQAVFFKDRVLDAEFERLLKAPAQLVAVDLLGQSPTDPGRNSESTRSVANPREFLGFTLGYNESLFSARVHDVIRIVEEGARNRKKLDPAQVVAPEIVLVAEDGPTSAILASAAALAPRMFDRIVLADQGFRFAGIRSIRDPSLLPGAIKYGDLPGLMSLLPAKPTLLLGESEPPDLTLKSFKAAGAEKLLEVRLAAGKAEARKRIIDWILAGKN